MTVFADSQNNFKIDLVKFTYTLFLHTIDVNLVEKEIPKLIENFPTKDYDSFNSYLKLNIIATHKASLNNKTSKSILDKLKSLS